MKKIKKYVTKTNLIILCIILFSTILSSLFILDEGLYNGVDTQYHLSRIAGIAESWKAGNIPAYIHLDGTGYGYAMGFFYSNAFMILPCIFYLLGMDIIFAYKIFIVLCSLFTALSMYLCVKKITKSKYAATIATILYTTCGYRIITLVAKAFVGEILSFIFIPIIILGLYELIFNDEKKWWIFALGFIGILNSNLVMTEIMIAISAVIIICNIKSILKTRLLGIIKATFISLLITAMFWMPLIEQLCKSTFELINKMDIYQPTKWLQDFTTIFSGTIQYKHNLASAYGLGIIFIFLLALRLIVKEKNKMLKFCDISIIVSLLLLLCTTTFFPWQYLKTIGGMIQFPSRLEIPIVAFLSIACGIICIKVVQKKSILKPIILIVVIIWQSVFSIICLQSCIDAIKIFHDTGKKEDIMLNKDFEYDVCDGVYLPKGASYMDAKINSYQYDRENLKIYKSDNIQIKQCDNLIVNNKEVEIECQKQGLSVNINFKNNKMPDTYIEVPLYYYYGYEIQTSDNISNYKLEKGDRGAIRVLLGNQEEGSLRIYYKMTSVQKISIIITICTLLFLAIYMFKKKINERRVRTNEKKK